MLLDQVPDLYLFAWSYHHLSHRLRSKQRASGLTVHAYSTIISEPLRQRIDIGKRGSNSKASCRPDIGNGVGYDLKRVRRVDLVDVCGGCLA